ncbi:hypothetical protein FJ527_09560 [Mesorhizobium sp. B2-4-18]|nr:hypothetical protein FJ527_09560 [Mesorhizobium sp. B2-4-18]
MGNLRQHGRRQCAGQRAQGWRDDTPDFVILGRSKERSDAAQTLESMPRRRLVATIRANRHPLRSAPLEHYDSGNGMDSRVSATSRRSCSALE